MSPNLSCIKRAFHPSKDQQRSISTSEPNVILPTIMMNHKHNTDKLWMTSNNNESTPFNDSPHGLKVYANLVVLVLPLYLSIAFGDSLGKIHVTVEKILY